MKELFLKPELSRFLQDLVTLVTGGASGLGRATADRFLQQGAKVVICDLKTSKGEEVAEEFGDKCIFVPTDVSKEEDVKNALSITKSKFGGLNVAVNCAGLSVAFKIYNFLRERPHHLQDMEKVFKANVSGTFNVTRLATSLMKDNEPDKDGQRGVIINTTSTSAYEGIIGQSVFSSCSRSIVSMTLTAARDLESHGIRCCSIAAGYIDTELLAPLPSDVINFISDTTIFPKRLGKPHEFAHLAQCIIENSMLNGEVIRLDGGCRLHL